jgi:hypothetical protein
LERLQVRLNAQRLVDLHTWFVGSTNVRASRAAAGAKKGYCEALDRSLGGFSTKLHLVRDGLVHFSMAVFTPGQQDESTVCTELLASVRVRTSAVGGRPRSRPKLVATGRGYDTGAFRRYLRCRGIRGVVPEKRVPAGKRRRGGAGVLLLSVEQPTDSAVWSSVRYGGSRSTGGSPHALRGWPVISGDSEVVVHTALLPRVGAVFRQYIGEDGSGPIHPPTE